MAILVWTLPRLGHAQAVTRQNPFVESEEERRFDAIGEHRNSIQIQLSLSPYAARRFEMAANKVY